MNRLKIIIFKILFLFILSIFLTSFTIGQDTKNYDGEQIKLNESPATDTPKNIRDNFSRLQDLMVLISHMWDCSNTSGEMYFEVRFAGGEICSITPYGGILGALEVKPVEDSTIYISGDASMIDSILVPNEYATSGINDLIGKYILIEKYNNQSDVTVYDSVTVLDDTVYVNGNENSITQIGLPSENMAQRAPRDMIVKVEAVDPLPADVTGYFPIQDSIYICGNDSMVTIMAAPSDRIADKAPPQDMVVKVKAVNLLPAAGMTEYYRHEIDGYGHFALEKDTVEKVFLPYNVCAGEMTKKEYLLLQLNHDDDYEGEEEEYQRVSGIPPPLVINDTLYIPFQPDSLDTLLVPIRCVGMGSDSIIDSIFIVKRFRDVELSGEALNLVRMLKADVLMARKINQQLQAEAYKSYMTISPQPFVRQKKGIPTWLLAALGYTTGFFLLRGTL